jgi:hypothetical protein
MRDKQLLNTYREYFSKDVSNTLEYSKLKVIAIKRLKANRFKLNEMIDVIGICYKNLIKHNAREVDKELDLLFDTLVKEGIYPVKENNKVTFKKL